MIKADLMGGAIESSSSLVAEVVFTGFRFTAEVIVVAVRWYLRYNLSYRDVEDLLAERGVEVDHVTVLRWLQRIIPLLTDAARFARHHPSAPGRSARRLDTPPM